MIHNFDVDVAPYHYNVTLMWHFGSIHICKFPPTITFNGELFTYEWNGKEQPLGWMVFRWFWGQATIGFDGFQWLSTIGLTMEWLHTIVIYIYVRVEHFEKGNIMAAMWKKRLKLMGQFLWENTATEVQ